MRNLDYFIFVFLFTAAFSGYMAYRSYKSRHRRIGALYGSDSLKFYSLSKNSMLNLGLWLMLFLASAMAATVNTAISFYDHKGFLEHEQRVPIYPGAVPVKILPDVDKGGRITGPATGIYEVNADPQAILDYYRSQILPGGWVYQGNNEDLAISLSREDENLTIVVVPKPDLSRPNLCELMFIPN